MDIIAGLYMMVVILSFGLLHIIYFGRDKLDAAIIIHLTVSILGAIILGSLI